MAGYSRRDFVKHVGVGAALAATTTKLQAAGANERVNLALIGCGVRGRAFYGNITHVCDPDQSRAMQAAEANSIDSSNVHTDFRKILDDPSIDAVAIATPDHWHAPAAMLACQAGKHVYVEKPVSHNFRESQLLQKVADRSGVVVQHGTQRRSNTFILEAIQMLKEGMIGEVLMAKAWNIQKRDNIGFKKPTDPPPGVDYDMWVGPAEYMPYQENRFHKDWHWWYNFGTGDIGNDGTHELDYARWGLGVETLPSRVTALGGKYFYDDQQEFPDSANCLFEFPGDKKPGSIKQLQFEMRLWSRNYPMNCDSGVEYYGTKGQMFLSKRGKLRVIDGGNKELVNKRMEKKREFTHLENFFDSIRGKATPNADLLTAHRSVGLVHLANISLRVGRSINFDPVEEAIVDDPQANQLLGRSYRKGGHWAAPQDV